MPMPRDVGVIDLMLSVPGADPSRWYDFMRPLLLDRESREQFEMPAQYMFKDIPKIGDVPDYIAYTIAQMDKHGIARAMVGVDGEHALHDQATAQHPDRFFGAVSANPNRGMDEVRRIERLYREGRIKAVTGFASGLCPQVPVNDKKWYPIYAKCVELDLPVCQCVGVPGPRLPMEPQKVEHLDEVCWFFPELKVVMRHGGEPWVDLAVKLMLKYPNLHYMTSAFAPRHYPPEIVRFANTRGAKQILYAGYFPMGLSLDRIFRELPDVGFKDEVWPLFLRDNALRVFKLDDPEAS